MNKEELQNLRRDYTLKTLSETEVDTDPIRQFEKWLTEALTANVNEPNAMTVSTVDENQKPHARIVLLKEVKQDGFVFYTNFDSAKGRQIAANPYVALTFYWPELERQVRIEGKAKKVSHEQSEKYFRSRPRNSQIGALASRQSSVVKNRAELEERFRQLEKEIGDGEIPVPGWWGGFIVKPESIEFWQGRESRLHDRVKYIANGNSWQIKRLSP